MNAPLKVQLVINNVRFDERNNWHVCPRVGEIVEAEDDKGSKSCYVVKHVVHLCPSHYAMTRGFQEIRVYLEDEKIGDPAADYACEGEDPTTYSY